jgi:hypothetical protein
LNADPRHVLNAPDYLFVSTVIANAHPEMMESIMVRSYTSYLPGELAKKWQMGNMHKFVANQQMLGRGWTWARISLLGTVLVLLQNIGALPFLFQRILIRFIQPFLLTGIVVLFMRVIGNSIYIGLACGLIALLIAFIFYQHNKEKVRKHSPVQPANDDEGDGKVLHRSDGSSRSSYLHSVDVLHLPTVMLEECSDDGRVDNESAVQHEEQSSIDVEDKSQSVSSRQSSNESLQTINSISTPSSPRLLKKMNLRRLINRQFLSAARQRNSLEISQGSFDESINSNRIDNTNKTDK